MLEKPVTAQPDEIKLKLRFTVIVKLLQVLVGLSVLYTLYFAQSLLLPLIFSALIALLLSPLVTRLKKHNVPRSLSAIVLLTMLIAPLSFMGAELSEPLERWMDALPGLSVHVTEQIEVLDDAFETEIEVNSEQLNNSKSTFSETNLSKTGDSIDQQKETIVEDKLKKGTLDVAIALVVATPLLLAQVLGSIVLVLFLLIFGPPLFTVFVHDFPIVKNKERANTLVKGIQQALSKYIVTISLINTGLGVLTALSLSLIGVEDAILWGAIVGLFNFVPYLGLLSSSVILGIVGLVQFGVTADAVFPVLISVVLNLVESQIVTPGILGKSMRVNPLVIILWLLITGWLWGVVGVLLAVPLLVCIKLALEKLEILPHWLKLIEASESDIVS